jgi:hypothetical protein
MITGSSRGLFAKPTPYLLPRPGRTRATGGEGGGPSGLGCRRLELLGTRAPREKGRGERGDRDGVLTLGGFHREDGLRRRAWQQAAVRWRWRRYGDLEAQVSHGIERGAREEHVYELTGVGDRRDDRNPAGGAALGSAPRAAAQTVSGGPG